MESSFTLLRVRGIPIGVNWSWLVVFGLVVWSLASALFPATYPGFDGTTYLFMALTAAGLFFASVLLHQLGHALRALREGMPIRGITLWLFGGVAHLAGSPPSPGAEFHVAICGPAVSAVLAAGFLGGAWVGDALGWPGTVQGVIDYLGRINLLVLAFNLIPALPLDGAGFCAPCCGGVSEASSPPPGPPPGPGRRSGGCWWRSAWPGSSVAAPASAAFGSRLSDGFSSTPLAPRPPRLSFARRSGTCGSGT